MLFEIPPFPREAIRAAAQRPQPHQQPRKRIALAAFAAGLSLVAIAAAAEVAVRTHVTFNSGGIVLSSDKLEKRAITSNADVQEAATHLSFRAVAPAGLPAGTTPVQLESGRDILVVKYELPAVGSEPHPTLWILLTDPQSISNGPALKERFGFAPGKMRLGEFFRVGDEQVMLVSNGLTLEQANAIKQAMLNAR